MSSEKTRRLTKTGKLEMKSERAEVFANWPHIRLWILTVLSVLGMGTGAYADVSVSSMVDRNALNPEDSLTLTIAIDTADEASVGQPTLPHLNDFEVLNEWTSQSQQASMVSTPQGPQFKKVFSLKYNFMLQPKRQGALAIGAVEVVVDGKTYNTKPISIRVAPGAGMQARPRAGSQPQPGQGRGQGRGQALLPPGFDDEDDDLFSALLRRVQPPSGGSRSLPINPNEAFFIQVDTDKTEAYAGEQVTASFYIYTRGLIRDLDTLKYPSLKGFWKEDIEIATHLNFEQEVVNGVPYKKALLASFALFPIKEGTAVIDPYQAKCTIIPATDAFGMGLGQAFTFTKASQPVKIAVRPVPVDGRPADYSGAVGDFQVTSRVEDKVISEGQPLTLKIRFEGRGNAKLIDLPPFQAPEGMELYDQQNEAKFFRTGVSYKEFRVLLIPRHDGDFTIPALSVSIFDPVKRAYVKKTTEPVSIHVGKGVAGKSESLNLPDPSKDKNAASVNAGAEEPHLITDWRPSPHFAFLVGGQAGAQGIVLWIILFAAALGFLIWRARTELGWGQKKKDLLRRLKSRLVRVESRASAGDWRGVGTEMTNTVYFVLGEITGEGGAHLELEKLLMKAPPSIRRELAVPLAKQMEIFHILTFAPEAAVGRLKDPDQIAAAIREMGSLMEKAVALGLATDQCEKSRANSSGQSGGSAPNPTTS